jgi:hypothetical protein
MKSCQIQRRGRNMISLVHRLLRVEEEVEVRLSTSILMTFSATLKMILDEILSTLEDILMRNRDTVSLTLKTFSKR